ncbi:hypothetical protein Ancab_025798 [Ancistrocladus abbreviatus]
MHKELEASANQIAMDSFKGASVARVHDVTLIPSLQQRLRHAGVHHCIVRHMGGDLVLLSSSIIDPTHSSVIEGIECLSKWLTEIWNFEVGPINEAVQVKVGERIFSIRVAKELGGGCVCLGREDSGNPEVALHKDQAHVKERLRGKKLALATRRVACGNSFFVTSENGELNAQGERKAAARSALRGKQAHRVDCDADLARISGGTAGQEKGGGQHTIVVDLMEPSGPDLACKAKKDGGPDAPNSDSLNVSIGPKSLKSVGLGLKNLLRNLKLKHLPCRRRSMKPLQTTATLSGEAGRKGILPPATSTPRTSTPTHSETAATWSCEVGDEGTSFPANRAGQRKGSRQRQPTPSSSYREGEEGNQSPAHSVASERSNFPSYFGSMSAAQIWEVRKALGVACEGDESEVLDRLMEIELKDSRAWEIPLIEKLATRTREGVDGLLCRS